MVEFKLYLDRQLLVVLGNVVFFFLVLVVQEGILDRDGNGWRVRIYDMYYRFYYKRNLKRKCLK